MTSTRVSKTAQLAWLLFPRATPEKLLMFAAYYDDSGTHDDTGRETGSQVVVAAGYVGQPSEWQALEEEWNALLERESLKLYHAVDCVSRQHQFSGREHAECNRIHRAFIEVITARRIVAAGCALNTAPHNRGYRAAVPDHQAVAKPGYFTCLFNAWKALGAYMAAVAPNDQVSIVVEDSPKTRELTLATYDKVIELGDERGRSIGARFAGPPAFRSKEGFPQLQAADVLAYEMAVNLRRLFVSGQPNQPRRSWDALAAHAQLQSGGHSAMLLRFAEHDGPPRPGSHGGWSVV